MKSKRCSLLMVVLLVIGFYFVNCNVAHALDWMNPITTEDGYSARMTTTEGGIEVLVNESQTDINWGIQAISNKTIPIKEKKYKITFEAISNKNFDLFSRLGESNHKKGNSYKEYSCPVDNYDNWKLCSHEFKGYGGNNYLYFQFGFAPKGTLIKIRNIQITEIK